MTRRDLAAVLISAAIFAGTIALMPHRARAESLTVDQAKEILRLQYTEFCATVKMPPQGLIVSVQAAAQAGNEEAAVTLAWLGRIVERYRKNGCGDA